MLLDDLLQSAHSLVETRQMLLYVGHDGFSLDAVGDAVGARNLHPG